MKQTARRLTLGLSIAVVTVCAGCASDVRMPADSSSSAERPTTPGTVDVKTPRVLKKSELSEAEILYGRAPRPDPSVTYQDDVVIVEGGAGAIRSVSPE